AERLGVHPETVGGWIRAKELGAVRLGRGGRLWITLGQAGARLATVPTIEPSVSFEKLGHLLAEGHESELLDFKGASDLSETRDTVEFAKDIGAMQVLGGYIVVGADDHGNPTGGLTTEQAQFFDESRLRAKLRKYLP